MKDGEKRREDMKEKLRRRGQFIRALFSGFLHVAATNASQMSILGSA